MEFRLLAVGDVVTEGGLDCLRRYLRPLQRELDVHFTVVNGENAAGLGLLPRHAEEILDAGADVVTLGNHTWNRRQIVDALEDNRYLLRPANFAPNLPGRGFGVYDAPRGLRVGVLNLMGRFELDSNLDSPFQVADRILAGPGREADLLFVDFHAEATSEKGALAWYLDGRVQGVWGTHTHVPTADPQVLPRGTGFITDLGMTGPARSILGVKPENSVARFLGQLPRRYEGAGGPNKLGAVLFTVDTDAGRCLSVTRVDRSDPLD